MGQTPDDRSAALRISDAEREAVTSELARHRAEGRLTLEELSQRVDQVHAAATAGELEPVTRDLPDLGAAYPARRPTRWLVAFMGGTRRTGRWRIAGRTRAISIMGGCELDLRAAEIVGSEARITCFAWMGGVQIVVPEGVEVDVTGFTLIGGRDVDVADAPRRPGTPLVRVRAFAFMGGVSVQTPPNKLPG